uniref:Tyrosine-protein phosphatase domain-containing protein n=1 Tax=Mesocestoides corti TaxID=53468 RepID=A0A5K3FNE1_MESCO
MFQGRLCSRVSQTKSDLAPTQIAHFNSTYLMEPTADIREQANEFWRLVAKLYAPQHAMMTSSADYAINTSSSSSTTCDSSGGRWTGELTSGGGLQTGINNGLVKSEPNSSGAMQQGDGLQSGISQGLLKSEPNSSGAMQQGDGLQTGINHGLLKLEPTSNDYGLQSSINHGLVKSEPNSSGTLRLALLSPCFVK